MTIDGLNNSGVSPTEPSSPTGAQPPVTSKGGGHSSSDSVGKSSSTTTDNAILAESPELKSAVYMLWISNGQITLQPLSTDAKDGIKSISLEFSEANRKAVTNMLDEWSKSIAETSKSAKDEEKSQKHIEKMEENLKAGYEAYLSTFTQTQRAYMIDFNTLTGVPIITPGLGQGLQDLISKANAGSDEIIPFMSGAMMSAMTGTLAINSMQTAPITGGVGEILSQIAPAYSVDLSSLANLYINGGINLAAVQTLFFTPGASSANIDFEFGKNYAHQVLKLVKGNDFNSLVMAIVTHDVEGGATMDDKYVADAINKVKIAMLATALSFLYFTETGGITGKEFKDLYHGKIKLGKDHPANKLVNILKDLIGEQDAIITSISSWIDVSGKGLNLTRVSPLFNQLKQDSFGIPVVA